MLEGYAVESVKNTKYQSAGSGRAKSYEDLEIYCLSRDLAVQLHEMTMQTLPKFELYEEGSQIRRASKSIASNIAEGYGRKEYPQEFFRYLTYALASCDETKVHLDILHRTGSLKDPVLFKSLFEGYETLGKKLFAFRQKVKPV